MNPFRFRARIDQLWRTSAGNRPGYIRLKALNTVMRELFAPTPRAQANYALYLATDPFDVARHKLRDLYDRSLRPPLPLGEGWGEDPRSTEDEPSDEDDDPL